MDGPRVWPVQAARDDGERVTQRPGEVRGCGTAQQRLAGMPGDAGSSPLWLSRRSLTTWARRSPASRSPASNLVGAHDRRRVRCPRAGPAAVLGSRSRPAPRNSPNAFRDQACPPRSHRHFARDSWPDRRGRPLGDRSRHRAARRPRSSRPLAGSGQSCERSRPGSQCRPTPGRPGTCECRSHVPASSISTSGLGGDMGDAQGFPALPRSARRRAGRFGPRDQPTAEERDT